MKMTLLGISLYIFCLYQMNSVDFRSASTEIFRPTTQDNSFCIFFGETILILFPDGRVDERTSRRTSGRTSGRADGRTGGLNPAMKV